MVCISEFENLLLQMLYLEVKLDEEEKTILLLIFLPKFNDHLMTILNLERKLYSLMM